MFTLVPGRGGEPIISPHLKALRPFLRKGDFAPGGWGQQLVDALAPADVGIEKIAYSAFHASRLEWTLRKCGVEQLYFTGIVTNGGVASTVRDAHVREFECTVIEDGCAAFGEDIHRAAIEGLRPVAKMTTIAELVAGADRSLGPPSRRPGNPSADAASPSCKSKRLRADPWTRASSRVVIQRIQVGLFRLFAI